MSDSSEPEPQHHHRLNFLELAALWRGLHKLGVGSLRLPGLTDFEVCHGYAHGCRCVHCMARESGPLPAPPAPAQPWEPKVPRSRSADVIDINTPAGAPPRSLLMQVVGDVFDQVMDAEAVSAKPPQLEPAIAAARAAQHRDDVDDLVDHLRNVAHAAITSIVRVRASHDPVEEASSS